MTWRRGKFAGIVVRRDLEARVGFEPVGTTDNTEVADSSRRQKRQNRQNPYIEVHAGYTVQASQLEDARLSSRSVAIVCLWPGQIKSVDFSGGSRGRFVDESEARFMFTPIYIRIPHKSVGIEEALPPPVSSLHICVGKFHLTGPIN